jgi:hypothetical protein
MGYGLSQRWVMTESTAVRNVLAIKAGHSNLASHGSNDQYGLLHPTWSTYSGAAMDRK